MTAAPTQSSPDDVIALEGVSKRFGGLLALDDVSFRVRRGEVHAIVGGNGAGKSSLMKILAGVQRADGGRVLLDGRPAALGTPRAASDAGIAIVFQELNLFPHRSVMANLFVNRELTTAWGGLRRGAMRAAARRALDDVGLAVSPEARVGTLSLAERQLVEIARALRERSRVLILDEPNSALNDAESQRLFAIVRGLRDQGVTVLYVSQRLEDVFALADRLTVLRDGRHQGTFVTAETSMAEVIARMTGQPADTAPAAPPRAQAPDAAIALQTNGLRARGLAPLHLTVRAGEIVGLAGLEGAGVDQIFRLLFGLAPALGGTITVAGEAKRIRAPADAMRAGIAFVPPDRRDEGLFMGTSVLRNAALLRLDRLRARFGGIDAAGARREAAALRDRLRIVAPDLDAPVATLSGGNQQKVLLGRWLATRPRVLLLHDPTRGVDVAAKREIRRLCAAWAADGMAILWSSSELEETVELCDRVLVVVRGAVVKELARGQSTKGAVMHLMNGGEGTA